MRFVGIKTLEGMTFLRYSIPSRLRFQILTLSMYLLCVFVDLTRIYPAIPHVQNYNTNSVGIFIENSDSAPLPRFLRMHASRIEADVTELEELGASAGLVVRNDG
jgi:hypothetical protein